MYALVVKFRTIDVIRFCHWIVGNPRSVKDRSQDEEKKKNTRRSMFFLSLEQRLRAVAQAKRYSPLLGISFLDTHSEYKSQIYE